MAGAKTNAIRIIEQNHIPYTLHFYENNDGKIDGISVAEKIGLPKERVFKTLVAIGHSRELYVFVVPVAEELDLKKCALCAAEKNIEMIPVKDITKWTGYIRGGCSPVGMKKQYKTFIHSSAEQSETIVVSAGKIGMQMELSVHELVKLTGAQLCDLIKV